jgi:hypothetical protein
MNMKEMCGSCLLSLRLQCDLPDISGDCAGCWLRQAQNYLHSTVGSNGKCVNPTAKYICHNIHTVTFTV